MTDVIATETVDGCVVVTPTGALDVATSPALHTWVHRSLDEGATLLVLDLSEEEFIDSTALRDLVSVHKRLLDTESGRWRSSQRLSSTPRWPRRPLWAERMT